LLVTGFASGFLMGLGLIVAIGAQNVFVLRQGLRREHVGLVVAICAASDAMLIAAGVAGLGAVITHIPWFATVAKWAGAAFLLVYGILAARRALRPSDDALDTSKAKLASGWVSVALTCLAFTWLNPHVYLDTVVLLGAVALTKPSPWLFAAGAMAASVTWFSALGFGATRLAPVLSTARAWRILDGFVALTMVVLAVTLILTA
jgi:L-lysine exporter family protein LysE/ArgO